MTKKKKNSRAKGKRGELAACQFLRELGFPSARRTEQYCGTEGTSDITCKELPALHLEVKVGAVSDWHASSSHLKNALQQAVDDSSAAEEEKFPVVLWKPDRLPWRLSWQYSELSGATPVVFTVTDPKVIRWVLIKLNKGKPRLR